MEITYVQDRESLEDYLYALPDGLRTAADRKLAFYASARVLPVAARYFFENASVKNPAFAPLPVFAAVAFAEFAIKGIDPSDTALDDVAAAARAAAQLAGVRPAKSAAGSAFAAAFTANVAAAHSSYDATPDGAYAVSFAADAADAVWEATRADLTALQADPNVLIAGLWVEVPQPDGLRDDWAEACRLMRADKTADWSFWIAWYDRVLAGRSTLPEMMAEVLNPLREEDWEKGPAHINPKFDGVLEKYLDEGQQQPDIPSDSFGELNHAQKIAQTKAALIQHRKNLRPTFDDVLQYGEQVLTSLQNFPNSITIEQRALIDFHIETTKSMCVAVQELSELIPDGPELPDADAEQALGPIRQLLSELGKAAKNYPDIVDEDGKRKLDKMVEQTIDGAVDLAGKSARVAFVTGVTTALFWLVGPSALVGFSAVFGKDAAAAAKSIFISSGKS